jgi:hypothetical protein
MSQHSVLGRGCSSKRPSTTELGRCHSTTELSSNGGRSCHFDKYFIKKLTEKECLTGPREKGERGDLRISGATMGCYSVPDTIDCPGNQPIRQ